MVDYEIYTIGWICAIRAELVAAQELLDEELMEPVPTPENDNNNYTLGKIGEHHVVIAGLPRGQYGVTSAASAARDMVRTFPNVRIGFMVGIGGGIPTHYDIRLGDVVVGSPAYRSGGLVQYDFGKTIQGNGIDLVGTLNQPPISVLTAITKLSAYHVRKGHNLTQIVEDVLSKNPNLVDEGFQRPHDDIDKLYESKFVHPRAGAKCSDVCLDSNLKQRDPRTKGQGKPKIHYGLIASGSQLMEDALARDELAEKEHVLCFEMEAAGLANHFPCVVIRGICDYSDSHRGREWQGYAALVSAAYAKELLLQIPPQKIKEEKRMKDILMNELDKRFEPVTRTKEIVEALDVKRKREDELKILDWLNAVDYSSEQHGFLQPEQRQPGTGQQFLSSNNFQTWMKTKNSLLFCSGMPGAGKTITTAIAIEYLQSKFKNDPTVGLAYVYCSYQKREQQKPQELFTSLLKQLALHQLRLPKSIHDLYEKNHNGRVRPTFGDIVTTLCETVDSFSSTFIIIDALDEHDAWDAFLVDIIELQKKTTANIFLTSRPKTSLPAKLKECLVHDIQADDQDVALYIDQKMRQMMVLSEENTELSEKVKRNYRKLIREKLSKAVNGVFLLARIYLNNIKEETNLKGISMFLQNLPTGLRAYEDAYEKTICRIRNQGQKHRDLARKALTWLTFAREPLSKEEFRHALSVEEGMSELKDEDLQMTDVILHLCMGLVKIDESNIVSLLHFTTMEYLKANPNCLLSLESSGNPKFIDKPSDSETEKGIAREYYEMKLATSCLTYLMLKDCANGLPTRETLYRLRISNGKEPVHKMLLYRYAARNWGYHARQGESTNKILQFLKSGKCVGKSSQCIKIFRNGEYFRSRGGYDEGGGVTGLHLTAFFGLNGATASLLRSGMEPDAKDSWGQTPLFYASAEGHADVVSQLLDFPVDIETTSDWKYSDSPRTALSYAAKQGHTEVVTLLLQKGAIPDSTLASGKILVERTPLSFASGAGHRDVVEILLRTQGVDTDSKNPQSRTPLSFASEAGHEATVELLLARGGLNPNFRDKDCMSPFHYAARAGHEAVVKLLLATNEERLDRNGYVDTNIKDNKEWTPLFHAVFHSHISIVETILARTDTDPNARDFEGRTILSLAVDSHPGILKLLLSNKDIVPDLGDCYGRTPLSHAAGLGKQSAVRLLLADYRVRVNSQDHFGRTPVSYAAANGKDAVVKYLLDMLETLAVNMNAMDNLGKTPFLHAVEAGHYTVCLLFLENSRVMSDYWKPHGLTTPLCYLAQSAYKLKYIKHPTMGDNTFRPGLWSTFRNEGADEIKLCKVMELIRILIEDIGVNVYSRGPQGQTAADILPELKHYARGLLSLAESRRKRMRLNRFQ